MRLAIIGATGMVGREILNVLSERNFCIKELTLVASEKSCGKTIFFEGKNYKIISLPELLYRDIDVALFSAGAEVSKTWAPRLAEKNVKVIKVQSGKEFLQQSINNLACDIFVSVAAISGFKPI